MPLRDHEGLVIEQFNGLWDRGDNESAPSDHFTQADNIQFVNSGVETRDPIDKYQEQGVALGQILRVYNYVMQTGQSLIMLTKGGKIYHAIGKTIVHGPILTIPTMTDFGFVAIAGRAYITPFYSVKNAQGRNYEIGLPGEFLYVYKGDGTPARKAAGFPPSNSTVVDPGPPVVMSGGSKPFIAFNLARDGVITRDVHIIAVAFDAGLFTVEFTQVVEAPGDQMIQLTNLPIGPVGTTKRIIAMTKAIEPKDYNPDHTVYIYHHVEDIPDNTTVNKVINKADADLGGPIGSFGAGPTNGGLIVKQDTRDGFCDFGFHLVAVVYETDTGYLTAPGPEFFGGNTYVDIKKSVKISNIPVSPSAAVKRRHLISTKWIPEYNGDQKGYQFFFIPKGTIDNNTDTELVVDYYDADLLSDASHLVDNFSEIPAGVNLNTYHSRLVMVGDGSPNKLPDGTIDTKNPDNRSVARVSAPGEPEAISQVDGLIVVPLDGNPLTNCQEFRDVLYLFKSSRTFAYSDNDDVPSSWQEEALDQGVGAPVHGIATVLDTGGVNVDFLLIADWSGLMIFNGVYARPELSWKIEDFWMNLVRNDFRYIQIINDSLSKKIWITLPPPFDNQMLYADYGNGMDAKNVRWAKWIFHVRISSVCIIDTTTVIIGAVENAN